MSDDRSVHAGYGYREIVRYDRGGKWYVESSDPVETSPRRLVSVRDAAALAFAWESQLGGVIFFGKPGGNAFEREVIKAREAAATLKNC